MSELEFPAADPHVRTQQRVFPRPLWSSGRVAAADLPDHRCGDVCRCCISPTAKATHASRHRLLGSGRDRRGTDFLFDRPLRRLPHEQARTSAFAAYGLPARGFLGKNFWSGALWGFVMLSFIVAMMAATHAYSVGGLALSTADLMKYGLLWALAFLMVGFFEEFSFRGYIQYTLTSGIGFWPAALITCLVFAGSHINNPGENWIGVVEIVLIALFLCLALRRTGNLWFAIGWHMSFDWGESFFYSTPNSGIQATGHMLKVSLTGSKWLSGGSVGPEASVFDLIVTIAGILLLAKLYPQAKYPEIPPDVIADAGVNQPITLRPATP